MKNHLLFALALLVAAGCGGPIQPASPQPSAAETKAKSELAAKLRVLPPAERVQFLRSHMGEAQQAFASIMPGAGAHGNPARGAH